MKVSNGSTAAGRVWAAWVRYRRILLKKSAARPVLRCAAAALLAGGLVSVGRSEVGASLFRG